MKFSCYKILSLILILGMVSPTSVSAIYIEADFQNIRIYDDSILGEQDDILKREFLRERYSP